MPDIGFLFCGLIGDIGWLRQLISGFPYLFGQAPLGSTLLVAIDVLMIIISVLATLYLGRIHEKEIPTRYQKDMSFGLITASDLVELFRGSINGLRGLFIGAILNVAGGLPLFLSLREGIQFSVK